VRNHPAHVSRILKDLGWTPQKPIRRARQHKEAEIQHWKDARWPALHLSSARTNKFYHRSWAHFRRTLPQFSIHGAPLLLDKYTYKHLSLVGAAAPQGKLFLTVYALSITSQEVVLLPGQRLRIIAGLLLVIGTVFRRIAPGSSMPTWQMELPGASTWSNCQAVPLTSTRPNGFGAI
jgi:hypothetical protein